MISQYNHKIVSQYALEACRYILILEMLTQAALLETQDKRTDVIISHQTLPKTNMAACEKFEKQKK